MPLVEDPLWIECALECNIQGVQNMRERALDRTEKEKEKLVIFFLERGARFVDTIKSLRGTLVSILINTLRAFSNALSPYRANTPKFT